MAGTRVTRWGMTVALLAGCVRGAEQAPAPVREGVTVEGRYRLAWRTVPDPIPLSALFDLETTVVDAATGAPVEVGAVRVDARMPDHGHGMATRPLADPGVCDAAGACRHPGGVYRTRGMKFHMPGEWVLSFDVEGPAGPGRLEVVERR